MRLRFKFALNRERALREIIRQLQQQAGRRIRQDERLADLEVFDDEGFALKQLHTGFEHHFDKTCGGKDDEVFDTMILQEGHVAIVESS
jgi:hypothetical protein